MYKEKRQLLILLVLNLILGLALLIGIPKTVQIVDFISGITISSFVELKEITSTYVLKFLSEDIKYIAGVLFGFGIVIYDIIVFFKWFNSFKFTTKKFCTSCNKKIIREQRNTADRLISTLIPVHRYRCIGCGQEYLKVQKRHRHEHEVVTTPLETEKIKA